MKRDMWITLRRVAVGKAIVITTRKHRRFPISFTLSLNHTTDSMEEAAALASKVGIIAKRLLGK